MVRRERRLAGGGQQLGGTEVALRGGLDRLTIRFSGLEGCDCYGGGEQMSYLRLNGRRVGRAAAGPDNDFRALFAVDYEPGELVAVALREGAEVETFTLRSASDGPTLAVTAERSEIAASDRDLGYIAIELRDARGELRTCDDRLVHVEVSGPAVLQGLGSGRPDTTESYVDDVHNTFDGRALAIVRPTDAGEITVTVTSEGLAAASVRLTAG